MQKYLLIISLLLLVGFGVFAGIKIDSLEKELTDAYNLAAQRDTITVLTEDSTLYRKAALEIKNLKSENNDLNTDLNKTRAKLRSATELVGYYRSQIDSAVVTPMPEYGDSVVTVTFADSNFSASMKQNTHGFESYTPPYDFEAMAKLHLNVYISETKNHQWNSYVETPNKNVVFTDIKTKVSPYQRSWTEKVYLLSEVSIVGNTSVGVGLGYEKYGYVGVSLDETGARTYKIGKVWYPGGKK